MLSTAACGGEEAVATHAESGISVEVLTLEAQLLVEELKLTGQLDSERSVIVKPSVEGIIESGGIGEGRYARKGDVLFTLHNEEQAARLRVAEASLARARTLLERLDQLIRRDAASLAKLDEVRADFAIAKAQHDLARLELDRTTLRAPFDGEVGRWLVGIGTHVTPATPLTRIDALDRLQLTFGITEEALPLIRPGLALRTRVRSIPGESFPGEVYFVSPTLEPKNRRIWVKAWVPNADHRLRPGQFANVELELRRNEQAIVVPESAVGSDREGPFLWEIVDDARARRLRVETGLRQDGSVEVVQGLSPGRTIVTQGIHKLHEGASVRISGALSDVAAEPEGPAGSDRGGGS
jgi:membrane fusion protein (multidrug efflux system)